MLASTIVIFDLCNQRQITFIQSSSVHEQKRVVKITLLNLMIMLTTDNGVFSTFTDNE